jgi:hypothetical protein
MDAMVVDDVGSVIKLPGNLKRIEIKEDGETGQHPNDHEIDNSLRRSTLRAFLTC